VAETPSRATLDALARLIAHPTVSRTANLALIAEVEAELRELGARTRRVTSDDGERANLVATFGPADRGGIALSGHSDVVPTEGQPWSSDPFGAVDDGARVYGRGACDMKGFLACCLAHARTLRDAAHTVPVHLVISYDEEVGCVGARQLVAELQHWAIAPRAVIVGEPTEMRVVTAHKGKLAARATAHGRACHSALAPRGVNAVTAASRLAAHIADAAAAKANEGPFDHGFPVPTTTLHAGVIRGGTALNIVPDQCELDFEIRNLPDEDATAILEAIKRHAREVIEPEMHAVAPESGFTWDASDAFPGLATDPESAVAQLAFQLAGSNAPAKVAFGTEAGVFARAGMPAVVCGPGSIEQAHKPDEFVAHAQLARCERFLERLAAHLAAS